MAVKRKVTKQSILRDLKAIHDQPDNSDSSDLYDILTALRGPDFDDPGEEIKRATTAVIRYQVFGRESRGLVGPDSEESAKKRRGLFAAYRGGALSRAEEHFLNHARHAFDSLGLKWDKKNPDPWAPKKKAKSKKKSKR